MASETYRITEQMRAAVRLVARAFSGEVRPDFRDQVETYTRAPLSGLEPEAQKLADRGSRQLEAVLSKREAADAKQEWDDYLDASYAELFLGATMQTIAPQESVYYGRERIMYQQPYFDVVNLMREWGWSVPATFQEPEDHIAAEWLFYAFLLDKAAEHVSSNEPDARIKTLEAAASFKSRHMDSWMEKAFCDIAEADDVGFYTGMVNIARALLMAMK